jgi:GNAT superfamily N-acetyltransferase
MEALPGIRLDAAIGPTEAEDLGRRLDAFNARATGTDDQAPLRIGARDPDGRLVAGIVGSTWCGWLYVATLWVDAAHRRGGLGSKLLQAAEAQALRRGCRHACLATFSYQARPFYERHGYRVFGQLEDYPEGETYFFLRKALA